MPEFTQLFAERAREQSQQITAALSSQVVSELDRHIRSRLSKRWLALTTEPNRRDPSYASDGSQAVRVFSNGWLVIVVQALLVGPGCDEPFVDVRFARANLPEPVVHRYAGLLMRLLELRAALQAAERAKGGSIYLDGSLAAEVPHLLYPLAVSGEADLPLQVLEAHLDLLDNCQRYDVALVAVSKTTAATSLSQALLVLGDRESLPADAEPEPIDETPCDAEVLFRWTEGTGFTQPLVLGVHALGNRRGQLMFFPDELVRAFEAVGGTGYDSAGRFRLLERLRESSAIASFHLRPRPGEDPLKVEVPSWSLGFSDLMGDLYFRWAPPDCADDVIAGLLSAYGGGRVYNAPVYVADRLVRLSRVLMDGPYLAVLRSQLGRYIQYERGARRFL